MRRWLALSAKLYPQAWRERYGAEFDALMEDVEPDLQEFANVLGGALKMQLKSDTAYLKLAAVMAVLGALAALGVSLRVPDSYMSSAVLKMTPPKDEAASVERLEGMRSEILSRNSLAELIQRPSLNLYWLDRHRVPMEDVVEKMRRDIRIVSAPATAGPRTFTISFIYPDRFKAEAVTRELTTRFIETNIVVNKYREVVWRKAWHEDPPPGASIECIASASDPKIAGGPNRLIFISVGLFIGVLIASTLRWPRPAMRLAALAAGGALIATAACYYIPNRYTSAAVMRITPPIDPKRWHVYHPDEPPAERVQRMSRQILSRDNLEALGKRPRLNLDLDDRDIRIQFLPGSAFSISFTNGDPLKAQAVVRELVTQFTERNIIEERAISSTAGPEYRMMVDQKLDGNLEVLDPASLPQAPVSPNRWTIAAIGLTAGLLLGIILICANLRSSAAGNDLQNQLRAAD